ncbi:MAG: hypothetical protein WAM14_07595, partial [Candidatus Nitrosopolaris sp.]
VYRYSKISKQKEICTHRRIIANITLENQEEGLLGQAITITPFLISNLLPRDCYVLSRLGEM